MNYKSNENGKKENKYAKSKLRSRSFHVLLIFII